MTLKRQSLSSDLVPKDSKYLGTPLKVGDKVVVNPYGQYKNQGRDGIRLLVGEVVYTNHHNGFNVLVRWPFVSDDWYEAELYYDYNECRQDVLPLIMLTQGFTE